MRIVAGVFRGRRLRSPRGIRIRPTTDRVREAIFHIIDKNLTGAHVLDLFAGTGALGLEALSRGAERVVFVDHCAQSARLIEENVALCEVQDRVRLIQRPVHQVIKLLAREGHSFHLIFMDPPYGKGYVEKTLSQLGKLSRSSTLVIAEHHLKDVLPSRVQEWLKTRERRYGDTVVSFFVREDSR